MEHLQPSYHTGLTLTSMVLPFGHVNVLLTISFILLELGLTRPRENSCYVAFKLSCYNSLNYNSTVDCCTDAEKPEQNGDDSSSSSDGLSPYITPNCC